MQTMLKQIEPSATSYSANAVVWEALNPDDIPKGWNEIAPFVRRALLRGDGGFAETDVMVKLAIGQWTLWLTREEGTPVAICIVEIVDFPRNRKCLIRYVAGRSDLFITSLSQLEDWARGLGCHIIEAHGRNGWKRLLPDWDQTHMIFQRKL